MILRVFKVRLLPRICSPDSAHELNQLIDRAEPLSDPNYTRFSQLDNTRYELLEYENTLR